jgi:hypothetical protein
LTRPEAPASEQIDAIIERLDDWRGRRLADLRALIRQADPRIVEEVKWKKPSNPAGVPVWSHDGIVCVGEALKSAVRLTFPKGALVAEGAGLFNARLTGSSVRAIDLHERDEVDTAALAALVRAVGRLNASS